MTPTTDHMPRCATCIHWGPGHDERWGTCHKITVLSGDAGAVLDWHCLNDPNVSVWYDTRYDHGCILHTPKESPDDH